MKRNIRVSFWKSNYSGSIDSNYSALNADTDVKLKELQVAYSKNKNSVVDKLLATVVECQPKIHINAKPLK